MDWLGDIEEGGEDGLGFYMTDGDDDRYDDPGYDCDDAGGVDGDDASCGESDGGSEQGEEGDGRMKTENCAILSEAEVRRRQEDDVAETCAVLAVPRAAARLLLLHHGWSTGKLQDAWFGDEEGVRRAVGLPSQEKQCSAALREPGEEVTCGICFDSYPCGEETGATAACGHFFCKECWAGYIGSAVADGPGCLALRCPEPGCGVAVDQDMVEWLGTQRDRKSYSRYLLRSYVERSRRLKWCPSPCCDFAVEFLHDGHGYDVFCRCMGGFCWNCGEDAHRPVDCKTVSDWNRKNKSETESTDYIQAYCKPCPRCKRPIEKNAGCMHMKCSPPCNFEFCWLCLRNHKNHADTCNRYEISFALDEEMKREVRKRDDARRNLERYLHYYTRWDANHRSRKGALQHLKSVRGGLVAALSEAYGLTEADVRFVTDAWVQVAECRRVLKWSYAYGYYLPAKEKTTKDFFEYLQGEAEAALERLHRCAEEGINGLADVRAPPSGGAPPEFKDYRNKLAGLTVVTRNYFDNLVRALEGGLRDVAEPGAASNINTNIDMIQLLGV